MIQDRLVEILGAKFLCVDEGFGTNNPVDVVIRPEDVELVKPEVGMHQRPCNFRHLQRRTL